MTAAGLGVTEETTLSVRVEVATFEEWWAALGFGIGPAGEYLAALSPDHRAALRARCRDRLSEDPIEVTGLARAAVARRPQL
jgi:hypothetical protein